jgi:hypothetical protein
MISQKTVKMKLGEEQKESNEIHDVNVSQGTNTGRLSENTTNTKSITKMSKAACDKKG